MPEEGRKGASVLTSRLDVVVILLLSILFVLTGCGKKGPPFLPEKDISLIVARLSADWKDGAFHFQGEIAGPQDEIDASSNIKGCRIFYAFYSVDSPPCEGCPIDYTVLKEIEGTVINEGQFLCNVSGEKKKGIYFFKVRLIGQEGETGPYSDRAKLVVDD